MLRPSSRKEAILYVLVTTAHMARESSSPSLHGQILEKAYVF